MKVRAIPRSPRRRRGERDSGITLVEVLVSIVLIGTVVVATLGALRISILGGTVHRDHANAHAWLQSASDVLYARAKYDCSTTAPNAGKEQIRIDYQSAMNLVPNPEDWTNSQLEIIAIELWNSVDSDGDGYVEFFFGTACQDDKNLSLQRITIQVSSPSGRIIEQVELIK